MELNTKIINFLRDLFFRVKAKTVFYINGPETLPPPLTKAEEENLYSLMELRPTYVKEQLVVHNLRLVVYIAKKFEQSKTSLEDLISIGTIGLIKAVNTFSPKKQIKLATYASRCIENEILMHLRKTVNLKNEVSLDEPLNLDADGNELLLCDVLGSDENEIYKGIEAADEAEALIKLVRTLPPREREIMELRFGLFGVKEKTQKEIADELGISQSYISRLEKRILEKLKSSLELKI